MDTRALFLRFGTVAIVASLLGSGAALAQVKTTLPSVLIVQRQLAAPDALTLFESVDKPIADADYTDRVKACNAANQCSGCSSAATMSTILMCGSQPC